MKAKISDIRIQEKPSGGSSEGAGSGGAGEGGKPENVDQWQENEQSKERDENGNTNQKSTTVITRPAVITPIAIERSQP